MWRTVTFCLGALACLTAPAVVLAQDVMRGHGGPVRALAVRAEARELISGSFNSTVIVWDLDRGIAKRVLRFHDGPIAAVTSIENGCTASAGDDKRIAVWCGDGVAPVHVATGHEGPVTSVIASARGFITAGHDGTIRHWTTGSTVESRRLGSFRSPVTALARGGGDGEVVAATADGRIRKLTFSPEPTGSVEERQSRALASAVNGLAVIGPEIIAISADGIVRIFGRNLEPIAEIEIDGVPLSSLAVSPDGRVIATAGLRGGIAVMERASRRILHRLTGPGLPVWSLAFDSDSRTLISGGADRVIRRWDAVGGRPLSTMLPERDIVAEAAAGGERGAVVFRACQACHTLSADGGNRAGPTLHGILGRRIGTAPGYGYSAALPRLEIVWSKETIARLFEVGPAAYTPGTKMPEQTITDPADRRALVDWLERVTRQ